MYKFLRNVFATALFFILAGGVLQNGAQIFNSDETAGQIEIVQGPGFGSEVTEICETTLDRSAILEEATVDLIGGTESSPLQVRRVFVVRATE
jgi:hypothetical protein